MNEIRAKFLGYFEKHGHTVVKSGPLVPQNDPSLMFANSGMVQFKNTFTGQEKRPYSRAATCQKCVRAGGKHNDLENVGFTARHHTFFEMLGNFSFGDYFKEDAIKLAWELVTKEYGLTKDRLLVTVFHDDDEAAKIWKKVAGFSDNRIIRCGEKDNFWRMGDTGPCGPCSEIFYDFGPDVAGGPPGSADEDGDRFIEIWNLVFMQFEQLPDKRIALPKPSIDTGSGLERVAAILQGKKDNYDNDTMRAIMTRAGDLLGRDIDKPELRPSFKVLADHIRTTAFLIAEGVLPSNEGRGYVLRRIMRRAMRHANMLGAKEPMFYKLAAEVEAQMGDAYPELASAGALIHETIKAEETRFLSTLDKGLKMLAAETSALKSGDTLSGETAFKLYDTYGFPLDLTADALRAKGIKIDAQGFDKAMAAQKEMARKAWAGSGDSATESQWFDIKERVGTTEFLGYSTLVCEAVVTAVVDDMIVVNQTPFYGEGGGQIGDAGAIEGAGFKGKVVNTTKKLGVFIHHVQTQSGSLKVGDTVTLAVDADRRLAIMRHHSVGHLLQSALRKVLGEHVSQKGAWVGADRLRFDFTHNAPVSKEQQVAVEKHINAMVCANLAVSTRLMAPEDAIKEGAIALFGEKYGDQARVVKMGDISVELCGGTHASRTGDIGAFKIVSEESLAAGVRRLESVAGLAAIDYMNQREQLLCHAAEILKTPPATLPQRVESLAQENKHLHKELVELKQKTALSDVQTEQLEGFKFVTLITNSVPAKNLRTVAEQIRKADDLCVIVVVGTEGGKMSAILNLSDQVSKRLSAVEILRAAISKVGGQGAGGSASMAQGGAPDDQGALKLIAEIKAALVASK